MSEDFDDDPSGLPVPPGDGADDPTIDSPQPEGDPYAPMEPLSSGDEQEEKDYLQLVNWCRDLERQLLELRALINQTDGALVGSQLNPKTLGSDVEGAETALTDTWSVAIDVKALNVWKTTRVVYNHLGDKKLYEFRRLFSYDSLGALYAVSAESRVEVDATTNCQGQ